MPKSSSLHCSGGGHALLSSLYAGAAGGQHGGQAWSKSVHGDCDGKYVPAVSVSETLRLAEERGRPPIAGALPPRPLGSPGPKVEAGSPRRLGGESNAGESWR